MNTRSSLNILRENVQINAHMKKNTEKKQVKSDIPLNTLKQIPKRGKILTSWDLKKHFYTSENDPQIEKDMVRTESVYRRFARTYKNYNFTQNAQTLLKALTDYEALVSLSYARKPVRYFDFRHTLNAKDSVAEKRSNLLENRLTKVANEVLFFDIALGKISKEKQREYLSDPKFSHFKYFLSRVFLSAVHTLTEPEERILNLKSGFSSGMWIAGTEKIISNREIFYEGQSIALPEAIEMIGAVNPEKKQGLWDIATTEFEQIAEVAENEFNAIINNKKISDELRHYKKPYSQTIQSYENDEKSVETLIEAMSTKGFDLSKRFYTLKAKLQGKTQIAYVNKYDSLGIPKHLPFTDAVDICREAFYGVRATYGEFFDKMLTEGTIDVYPKKGKRGGAFMASDVGLPSFVFLNHTNDVNSLYTLAHEMGHALHTSRSKTQSPLYESYSITTAETASTLFETIVTDALIQNADLSDQKILLHDKISRDITTVQRQIAFFNFELELHTHIRTQGAATKNELTAMMVKHLKSYLGKSITVTERDGLSFVYISHFRYFFYVYTYAYGHLMSSLMARNLLHDKSYAQKIDTFLSLGGSDTVENIFSAIGIQTRKVETFIEGLSLLEADIKKLEKMV